MNNLKFRAIELLKAEGIENTGSLTIKESEFYPIILESNEPDELMYFFLIVNGELVYDGWCKKTCIPINEVCLN